MKCGKRLSIAAVMMLSCIAGAQVTDAPDEVKAGIPVNYTEAKAGTYTLPDPLKMASGNPVSTAKEWIEKRRPEIVKLFEENQYGRMPDRPRDMHFDVFDRATPAFDGKAVRRQATIYFTKNKSGPSVDVLLYLPANAGGPVPVLLNVGFAANYSNSWAKRGSIPRRCRRQKHPSLIRWAISCTRVGMDRCHPTGCSFLGSWRCT